MDEEYNAHANNITLSLRDLPNFSNNFSPSRYLKQNKTLMELYTIKQDWKLKVVVRAMALQKDLEIDAVAVFLQGNLQY